VEDLAFFYSLLYSYGLGGGVDKIWWVSNKKRKFEVRSFYNILISHVSFPFPWKSIWRTKVMNQLPLNVLNLTKKPWQRLYAQQGNPNQLLAANHSSLTASTLQGRKIKSINLCVILFILYISFLCNLSKICV
jgi:hypothetical protein